MKHLMVLTLAATVLTSCDLLNLETPKTTSTPVAEDPPIQVTPMKGGPQGEGIWKVTGEGITLPKGPLLAVAGSGIPTQLGTGKVNSRHQFSIELDSKSAPDKVNFTFFEQIWEPKAETCEGDLTMNPKPFLSTQVSFTTEQSTVVYQGAQTTTQMVWVPEDISYQGEMGCKEPFTVDGESYFLNKTYTAKMELKKGWNLVVIHKTGNEYDQRTVVDTSLEGSERWQIKE